LFDTSLLVFRSCISSFFFIFECLAYPFLNILNCSLYYVLLCSISFLFFKFEVFRVSSLLYLCFSYMFIGFC
jgi:hypothetical protein